MLKTNLLYETRRGRNSAIFPSFRHGRSERPRGPSPWWSREGTGRQCPGCWRIMFRNWFHEGRTRGGEVLRGGDVRGLRETDKEVPTLLHPAVICLHQVDTTPAPLGNAAATESRVVVGVVSLQRVRRVSGQPLCLTLTRSRPQYVYSTVVLPSLLFSAGNAPCLVVTLDGANWQVSSPAADCDLF